MKCKNLELVYEEDSSHTICHLIIYLMRNTVSVNVEQECVTPVDVLAGCNISWHRLAEAANLTLAPVEDKRFAQHVFAPVGLFIQCISGLDANHGRRLHIVLRRLAWLPLWCVVLGI
jgi:hypothetical protein